MERVIEKQELISNIEYRVITSCRSCESSNVGDILSLGKHQLPEFGGGEKNSPEVPLTLCVCQDCSLVQLRHTTDPALLWNENYGYRSGVNSTMREHLKGIVESVEERIDLREDDIVVDIGCNDGTMLGFYQGDVMRVGFDPSENVLAYANRELKPKFGKEKVRLFLDYFNKELYFPAMMGKAKVVTAISMFYDLDNPNRFLRDVKDILDSDGIFVVQQNYLKAMVENTAFDNICHEHLEYYSLGSMETLLNRHGLEVFDAVETPINGGSFRTYIRHKGANIGNSEGRERVQTMRDGERDLSNPDIYEDFAERVSLLTEKIGDFVRARYSVGFKIYAYGASTRGGTLLQACGLGKDFISAAVDRNPDKWGKTMGSTGIPIISEEQARVEPGFMRFSFYDSSFFAWEREYLERGGKFIVPLPEPSIISYGNGYYTNGPI